MSVSGRATFIGIYSYIVSPETIACHFPSTRLTSCVLNVARLHVEEIFQRPLCVLRNIYIYLYTSHAMQ